MSRFTSRNRDPYWLTARFDGTCSKCKAAIKNGTRAFYYPNGRKLLCEADECGGQASRDFDAAAADEAFMNSY